jgi:hypothetical protein
MQQNPFCELIVIQLVKKFIVVSGIRKFSTTFAEACNWTLSWATYFQSTLILFSSRSILILSGYLTTGLPSGLFPSGFAAKILRIFSHPPPPPFELLTQTRERRKVDDAVETTPYRKRREDHEVRSGWKQVAEAPQFDEPTERRIRERRSRC